MANMNASPATEEQTASEDIKFYVELHNVSNFDRETKKLRSLVRCHVIPVEKEKSVKIITYYRPLKLSSKFSTRTRLEDMEKSSLVYQFTCPEPSCNEGYIGYTNQKLLTRIKQHRRITAPIYQHYIDSHNDSPPMVPEFKNNFTILYKSEDLSCVKTAEAIYIKNNKPSINTKYNELYDFLKLF